MGNFQQKEGSGALFKNRDKETENQADYNGNILIDGQEYWLSAWIKESKKGLKYFSVQANPKQAKQIKGAVQRVAHQQTMDDDFDDDIPF